MVTDTERHLTITDKAQEMLGQFAESADEGVGVNSSIEIVGRGPKGFKSMTCSL